MGEVTVWIVALAAGLYALHRLALGMEARGWLFYVNRRLSSSGGTADLFLGANSLFDSGARHRQEARRLDEARETEREPDDLDREER
jgi:hypothetical protein